MINDGLPGTVVPHMPYTVCSNPHEKEKEEGLFYCYSGKYSDIFTFYTRYRVINSLASLVVCLFLPDIQTFVICCVVLLRGFDSTVLLNFFMLYEEVFLSDSYVSL